MARSDKYDINKIRTQVRKKVGRGQDPTEFRPPKAEDGKTYKFRFFVLPPWVAGDKLATGPAGQDLEDFFLRNGAHYLENKRMGCPRVIQDEGCDICQYGFDLMSETEDKEARRAIASKLLPGTYMKTNIYFPKCKTNPEDLHGQVRWYNAPKTVFDIWEDCLFRDDDGGEPEEPLPFGVFYDEVAAYLFELVVVKRGQQNNYEKSKFVVTAKTTIRPIATTEGEADDNKIAAILAQRHDLFAKLPEVSVAEIERVARNLQSDGDGDDGGFDKDETSSAPKDTPKDTPKPKKDEKKKGIRPPVSESSESSKKTDDVDDDEIIEEDPIDEPDGVAGEVPVDESPAKPEPDDDEGDEGEPKKDEDDDDVDALLDQLKDD